MREWTTQDSLDLYNVSQWSCGYFSGNEKGNVEVRPQGENGPAIDLPELVVGGGAGRLAGGRHLVSRAPNAA